MALSNEKVVAGPGTLSVSWKVATQYGNAIMLKWRPTGSGVAWASAPVVQLAPAATSYVIAGLESVAYDVQVGQTQYGSPQTVTGVKPAPVVPAVPVNLVRPVIS